MPKEFKLLHLSTFLFIRQNTLNNKMKRILIQYLTVFAFEDISKFLIIESRYNFHGSGNLNAKLTLHRLIQLKGMLSKFHCLHIGTTIQHNLHAYANEPRIYLTVVVRVFVFIHKFMDLVLHKKHHPMLIKTTICIIVDTPSHMQMLAWCVDVC